MRQSESPSTSDLLKSLQCKLTTYAEHLRLRNPQSAKALRLESEAAALFEKGALPKLRAWSKEVDTWIRETLEPVEQELVAQRMKQAGILQQHLPRVWSVTEARRILRRGTIRGQGDLSVVRVALDADGHGHLSVEELLHLGRLLDEFTFVSREQEEFDGPHADA